MLRPSRPMIRPFISSDGRWTTVTVCSAVWSAATRWMAVTTMSRAFSWASSRARRSMARASLTASCSASSRTASMRMPLASSADMPRHALERGDLLAVGAGEVLAGLVELALAVEELAIALLEHVGALVELLVALEEPASRGRPARRAGRAPRPRPRAACAASRPWPRGSAPSGGRVPRPRSGGLRTVAAFIVCEAHRLRTSTPTTAPPTAATTATATTSRGPYSVPPIRPNGSIGGHLCGFGRSRSRGVGRQGRSHASLIPFVGRDRARAGSPTPLQRRC